MLALLSSRWGMLSLDTLMSSSHIFYYQEFQPLKTFVSPFRKIQRVNLSGLYVKDEARRE